MIENILANKTTHQLIRVLMRDPGKWFSMSKLRTEMNCGVGSLYISVNMLLAHDIIEKDKDSSILRVRLTENELTRSIVELIRHDYKIVNGLDNSLYPVFSDVVRILVGTYDDIVDIILYGSVARGRFRENSDIDICVIVKKKMTKNESMIAYQMAKLKLEREVNIIYFSSEEFEDMINKNHDLVKNIVEEGHSLLFKSVYQKWRRYSKVH